MSEREKTIYFILIFVIAVSLLCHFLFSWIGFNPTDEGFLLSLSRRILDGEFPHRDFIYIRPALSPVVHAPVIYFGGELTFWISRYFVWVELASIAGLWTYIIAQKIFSIPFEKYLYFFLALSCFVFSVYSAFIMAYTTYDALFFYSIGLVLCFAEKDSSILAGCFFVGLAYLCRQNFVFIVPITLIVLGYYKSLKYWLSACVPALIYLIVMAVYGGANDFFVQLSALSGKFHGGLKVYVTNIGFWLSVPAGYFLLSMFFLAEKESKQKDKSLLRFLTVLAIMAAGIAFLSYDSYPLVVSFCFFGFVSGMVLFLFRIAETELFKYGILILTVAWVTSISIGMSYPALLSGEMFMFAFILLTGLNRNLKFFTFQKKSLSIALYAFVTLLFAAGFGYARMTNVYRDKQAPELNYSVGSVLQGAGRIYTNRNTFRYLEDLQSAVIKAGNREFCILPDAACYWVKSERENPLPISWANRTETGDGALFERIKKSLNSDDSLVIITGKVYANSLNRGFVNFSKDDSYSPIIEYISSNFRKFDETEYFELFTK